MVGGESGTKERELQSSTFCWKVATRRESYVVQTSVQKRAKERSAFQGLISRSIMLRALSYLPTAE